ncbi:hypothetical protein UNDKW_2912 [Undibacterium sp. KW1]|uniref:hypothetical protein n=1 Tax=Undibacterium sp. KW1 TaxID=2058624 RepID=UPI001331FBD0|nr:hypothetical protein [Undibacterium sp. KW1]BBB61185.1 hypothetical protein UNDKW_2912 [Undibacterium sp. KW1]
MPPDNDDRLLTDADVKAVVDALENRIVDRFYSDLGKGVWSVVWKAIIIFLVGLAAAGAVKGIKITN